ncbi:radical SAM protein [Plantactinospora sp. CA-294935]|uniref:radical SAM protein n=1 Tax=Plantactinospora sp. CA-294935 TaxID=3240012 RepID=UPI003D934A67
MVGPLNLLALELNAVTHCNLSCVACSHSSPVSAVSFARVATVLRDFSAFARVTTPRYVRVVGGEPLLHPDLTGVLAAIREAMPGATIRLYTNGTRIRSAPVGWLRLVDELLVSVYPRAAITDTQLRSLARLCADSDTTLLVERFFAFRASVPERRLTDAEARDVFETCQMAHAKSCHVVQDGHVYLCPPSAPSSIGEHALPSCPILPTETLGERLRAFLGRPAPIELCYSCLGTVGTRAAHTMAPRRDWAALSHHGRVDYPHLRTLRASPDSDNFCSTAESWMADP